MPGRWPEPESGLRCCVISSSPQTTARLGRRPHHRRPASHARSGRHRPRHDRPGARPAISFKTAGQPTSSAASMPAVRLPTRPRIDHDRERLGLVGRRRPRRAGQMTVPRRDGGSGTVTVTDPSSRRGTVMSSQGDGVQRPDQRRPGDRAPGAAPADPNYVAPTRQAKRSRPERRPTSSAPPTRAGRTRSLQSALDQAVANGAADEVLTRAALHAGRGRSTDAIVVTGGTAGGTVVRDLLDHGHEVRNVDVSTRRDKARRSSPTDGPRLAQDALSATRIPTSRRSPAPGARGRDVLNNAMSTYNVFQAAVAHRMRRVVWPRARRSSACRSTFRLPSPPIDETIEPRPESSYALSKLVGETMATQLARRSGIGFVGLRISNIMEPGDYARFPSWQNDPSIRKWNLWGYVDARDVAQAVRLALEAPIDGAEICIVAAADTVMTRPSAELMAEVFPTVPLRRPVEVVRRSSRSATLASSSGTHRRTAGRNSSPGDPRRSAACASSAICRTIRRRAGPCRPGPPSCPAQRQTLDLAGHVRGARSTYIDAGRVAAAAGGSQDLTLTGALPGGGRPASQAMTVLLRSVRCGHRANPRRTGTNARSMPSHLPRSSNSRIEGGLVPRSDITNGAERRPTRRAGRRRRPGRRRSRPRRRPASDRPRRPPPGRGRAWRPRPAVPASLQPWATITSTPASTARLALATSPTV